MCGRSSGCPALSPSPRTRQGPGAVFPEKSLQGALPPPAQPNSQEEWGPRRRHGGTQGLIHLTWSHPGPTAVTQSLRRWGQAAPLSQDQRRQSSWLLPWQFRRAGSGSPWLHSQDLSPNASYGSDSPGLCGLPEQGPSLTPCFPLCSMGCSPCTASRTSSSMNQSPSINPPRS